MPKKQDKTEQLMKLTSDYLDAVVALYKDDSGKLAQAADEAVKNVKQESIFKGNPSAYLDAVSVIAIASILGY